MKSTLRIAPFLLPVLAGCVSSPAVSPGKGSLATNFLGRPEGRIAYDDTGGSGPLVIAVPSMGDLRGEYRFLRPLLVQAGYRFITLDVRGQGETSVHWGDYSARAVGEDVVALIGQLNAGPATVIGTSFAAGSALWAAHDAPEKIRGIVMIGPIVKDYPLPFFKKAALAIGFSGFWRVSFWTWYWDSLFPLRKPADHKAYREALAANLHEPGRMDALETMVSLPKAETAAILDKVRKAALIIMGSSDVDFDDPAAEAKSLASETGAQMLLVQGAGHYPQVETPAIIAPRIIEFMAKLP